MRVAATRGGANRRVRRNAAVDVEIDSAARVRWKLDRIEGDGNCGRGAQCIDQQIGRCFTQHRRRADGNRIAVTARSRSSALSAVGTR